MGNIGNEELEVLEKLEVLGRGIVTETPQLIRMAAWAFNCEMEKRVNVRKLADQIDDEKFHILEDYSHQVEGKNEYMRTCWIVKLKSSRKPIRVTIDICEKIFRECTWDSILTKEGFYVKTHEFEYEND